jgi:hypothetical protein
VVNATDPPLDAVPVTNRQALLSIAAVVSLVQPVGAAVCWKAILVPDGKTSTVPLTAGKVKTVEPATAGACNVTVPLVSPATTIELITAMLL